jgi:hypothetical protein
VTSALLLSSVSKKIFAKEKESGSKFELKKGVEIFYETKKDELAMPVAFVSAFDEATNNKVSRLISK